MPGRTWPQPARSLRPEAEFVSQWLRELLLVKDVHEAPSRFKDDLAHWVDSTEIAHLESERALDIRLTCRAIAEHRARLREDPQIQLRPHSSDWIGLNVSGPQDAPLVRTLIEQAAAAHRPSHSNPIHNS
jgi:Family of unknown function (DUF5519)